MWPFPVLVGPEAHAKGGLLLLCGALGPSVQPRLELVEHREVGVAPGRIGGDHGADVLRAHHAARGVVELRDLLDVPPRLLRALPEVVHVDVLR